MVGCLKGQRPTTIEWRTPEGLSSPYGSGKRLLASHKHGSTNLTYGIEDWITGKAYFRTRKRIASNLIKPV